MSSRLHELPALPLLTKLWQSAPQEYLAPCFERALSGYLMAFVQNPCNSVCCVTPGNGGQVAYTAHQAPDR